MPIEKVRQRQHEQKMDPAWPIADALADARQRERQAAHRDNEGIGNEIGYLTEVSDVAGCQAEADHGDTGPAAAAVCHRRTPTDFMEEHISRYQRHQRTKTVFRAGPGLHHGHKAIPVENQHDREGQAGGNRSAPVGTNESGLARPLGFVRDSHAISLWPG